MLIEFDKAGAEWVIVAYLSGEQRMIDILESGKSPHIVTGSLISRVPEKLVEDEEKLLKGETDPEVLDRVRREKMPMLFKGDYFIPRIFTIRQMGKKSNHALNYDEGYIRFALENEIEEAESKKIVIGYKTVAYPGLPLWHQSIREELRATRTLINLLGRKYEFKGAFDDNLFRAAYAYKPQSTVADIVHRAKIAIWQDQKILSKNWELLVQVHDSILLQYLGFSYKELAEGISWIVRNAMHQDLEAKGRRFEVKTECKIGMRWSDMYAFMPEKNEKKLIEQVRKICEAVGVGKKIK